MADAAATQNTVMAGVPESHRLPFSPGQRAAGHQNCVWNCRAYHSTNRGQRQFAKRGVQGDSLSTQNPAIRAAPGIPAGGSGESAATACATSAAVPSS